MLTKKITTTIPFLFLLFAAVMATGCTTSSDKAPNAGSAYQVALDEQNKALQYVTVYKTVPVDALGIRPVMAAACSSTAVMTDEDEAYILTGLKLKAYKLGGDGIAEVRIEELPASNSGCPGGVPVGGFGKSFSVQH